MSNHTHKKPPVYKGVNIKNNNVSKVVKVKNKGVKVRFEETPEGYPIGRTESGNVSFQTPALLKKREETKDTHFVLNPQLPPKRTKYPIDPNDFWNKYDIQNAKKEVWQEAKAKLKRQEEEEEENYSDYSNSDDSNSNDYNSNDSNSNISKCSISGGRSKKRRRRSQKRRRRNKKTHRHRKK